MCGTSSCHTGESTTACSLSTSHDQRDDLFVGLRTRDQLRDLATAALGVRETHQVLDLIRRVREHGLSVVLISHSIPEVFAIADRIHIHRLGRRAAIVSPKTTVMSDVVAVMTGALPSDAAVSAALAPAGAPDF